MAMFGNQRKGKKITCFFAVVAVGSISACQSVSTELSPLQPIQTSLQMERESNEPIHSNPEQEPSFSDTDMNTKVNNMQEMEQIRKKTEQENIVFILEEIGKQENIEANIIAEVESEHYDFDNPLVLINPYGISPLTALIGFTTEEPVKISVEIKGDDMQSTIAFDLDEYNTIHYIPIYGLYELRNNIVTLTAIDRSGVVVETMEHRIQTEALSELYGNMIISTNSSDPARYEPGLNFTIQQMKSAYDINGEYRWALPMKFLLGSTYHYENGNMILSIGATHQGDTIFVEINPLGKIFSAYYSPFGSHHHIEGLSNGNFIVTGSKGETIQDYIYEMDKVSGKIIKTQQYAEILQRMRLVPNLNASQNRDWLHMNALSYLEEDNSLMISSNMQSAVVKHDYDTQEIAWILSDPRGWANMFEQYLLTPIGEEFKYCYGQHLPQYLPDYDNNPNTVDILLFDNGRGRASYIENVEQNSLDSYRYSRMVHYRIDEVNMTVEQIWQYGESYGEELYSTWGGSALMLENGNRLGLFSVSANTVAIYYPHALEVSADGEVIWESIVHTDRAFGQFSENRLERLEIYNQSANALNIGTKVRDFIPHEIWKKYGY